MENRDLQFYFKYFKVSTPYLFQVMNEESSLSLSWITKIKRIE